MPLRSTRADGAVWSATATRPSASFQTGIGGIEFHRPRVRDRGADGASRIRFTSAVLPAYLRRAGNIEELLPCLYLKGVSTGHFENRADKSAVAGRFRLSSPAPAPILSA